MLSQIIKKSLFIIKTISFAFLSMVSINSYANDDRLLSEHLPVITVNVLKTKQINTIQELLNKGSLKAISYLSGIGYKHLEHIKNMITKLDLSFDTATPTYEESIVNRFSYVADANTEEYVETDED